MFGVLRLGGVATVPALIGAGSVSVVTLVVTVMRERRVSAQTVLVALLVAAGLGLTLVTHDPRLLLVKASVVFAVVGATMLASCRRGRPLFYGYLEPVAAARHPEGAAGFAASWADVPRFRFLLRRMTAVWGATWLVESVLRVVIVYAFPLERVGTALVVATVAIPVLLTPGDRRLGARRPGAAAHGRGAGVASVCVALRTLNVCGATPLTPAGLTHALASPVGSTATGRTG